ncbi:hypothetical protein DMENIID0001_119520 [Sergentomyia squamirostris]
MEHIRITYLKDPDRFWFCREDCFLGDEATDLRTKLSRALRSATSNDTWTPTEGEVVAFFQKNVEVWDRATVQNIASNGEITIWLEDLGFPHTFDGFDGKGMKTVLRPMPDVQLPLKNLVRQGRLFGIIPAKKKLNLETFQDEMIKSDGVWSVEAIDLMRKVVDLAETISFELKSSVNNVFYGNLVFSMPNGKKISARELLKDHSMNSEASFEESPTQEASKSPVPVEEENEWIEKSLDLEHDTFDESVSTYECPDTEVASGPPDNDKSGSYGDKTMIMDQEQAAEYVWTPNARASARRRGRALLSREFSAEIMTSDREMEKNIRSVSEAHNIIALELYKEKQQLPEKPLELEMTQSSRSIRKMPLPAGMMRDTESLRQHSEENLQVKLIPQEFNNESGPSNEEDLRHLGTLPVGSTAKKRYQRVLVHCPVPVKMIEKITEVCFREEVHQRLKRERIGDVYRVQSYGWPHLFRGGSIIIIGQRKSGKTLTYLPMLYTKMMTEKEKDRGEMGVGARAIVICSSSKKVIQTSNTFASFNDRRQMKLDVLASYDQRDTFRHVIELQNGYDVLFTTVPALKRLLQTAKQETVKLLTPKDIRYVVIDDYDGVTVNFRKDLSLVFKACLSVVDEHDRYRAQVVITSCRWMAEFRELWWKYDNPMVCIASGIEASLYGNAKFSMQIMDKDEKVKAVVGILSIKEYLSRPTMVVCNTPEEVESLIEILQEAGVPVLAFTAPEKKMHEIQEKCVILCTDACLIDINVHNIECLIHFSLPDKWSIFDRRFVVCFEYYEDQVSGECRSKSPVSVTILLDQDNNVQLPKLVNFMKTRFGDVEIVPEILQCANVVLHRREEAKIGENIPLCSAMLEFGECKIRSLDCGYRHVFDKSDAPSELLPKKGYVRLRILSVVSPLHFQGHILHSMNSHTDPYDMWTVVNESDKYLVFQNTLNGHMMVPENQITPGSDDVHPGELYLFLFEHKFLRVLIERSKKEKGIVYVAFTAIDVPMKLDQIGSHDLLVLPQEFKNFPAQLIDVRLFGLVPNDHELVWDMKTIEMVKSWIKSAEEYENSDKLSYIGLIELTMKNTIYVKSLFQVEYFDTNQKNFTKWSVKAKILKNKLGVESTTDRMIIIKELAKYYGIYTEEETEIAEDQASVVNNVDEDAKTTEKVKDDQEPQNLQEIPKHDQELQETPKAVEVKMNWMTIPLESLVDIHMLEYPGLDGFYVQDLSKTAQLMELEAKIKEFTANGNVKIKKTIKVGDYCLVSLDNMYYRGQVCQETELLYHVFLVDLGNIGCYVKSKIYEISPNLITDYDCFAIRCSLLGLKSTAETFWYDDLDQICEYVKFIKGPSDKDALQIYPVEESTITTNGSKVPVYSVIMLDREQSDIVINRRILEDKFAVKDPKKWPLVMEFLEEKLPEILGTEPKGPKVTIPEEVKQPEEVKEEEEPSQQNSSNEYQVFQMHPWKEPQVEWGQNNQEIFLTITGAAELKDYQVIVQPTFLSISLILADGHQGCLINLYGSIETGHTLVEVKPKSLVIILKKEPGGVWPNLVNSPDKFHSK